MYLYINALYPLEVSFLWYLIILPVSCLYLIWPVHKVHPLTTFFCLITMNTIRIRLMVKIE